MDDNLKRKAASPGALAYLVGEALRGGGIEVHQTKEKFGSIRVYVGAPNSHEQRMHYREVYLHAKWACPDLASNLIGGADMPHWLYETEAELDAAIARHVARSAENGLDAFDPGWRLARMLIRGENTDEFNQEDELYEEADDGS